MQIKEPVNKNYCATVVELNRFVDLENCDNVKHAIIFGNSVIVSKDTQAGTRGLFFPLETQLSEEFLSENNLYRKPELNKDASQKGYFEDTGRIRCVKFRKHKSEGFFIPISSLLPFASTRDLVQLEAGVEFDHVNGIKICEKYVIKQTPSTTNNSNKKVVKRISRLADNQFRLHVDTSHLKKNMHAISPNDTISLTSKLHGTSFVVGNILTKIKQSRWQRFLRWIGADIRFRGYDVIYASRRVVKNEFETRNANHFYGYDLWAEIKNLLAPFVDKGYTLYGEAVGFLKDGRPIQKGYDYGCAPNTFKVFIYRITQTNSDGKVLELSWKQVKDYCNKYGIEHVPELYYGKAKDLFPISTSHFWQETFLKMLEEKYLEKDCVLCQNKVPDEGICVKKDETFDCNPFKLKSFRFMEWETKQLDAGEADMESAQ